MSDLTAAGVILAAKLFVALQGYHSEKVGSAYTAESRVEQVARLYDIATQTVAACEERPFKGKGSLVGCVTLTATAAKWESGMLKKIHSGEQRGPAGERCLMQLHRTVVGIPDKRWAITHEEWANSAGLGPEATRRCLDLGVRVLGWHVHRCMRTRWPGTQHEKVAHLFAEYHRPSTVCQAPVSYMSLRRADSFDQLLGKLSATATPEILAAYDAAGAVTP